MLVVALVALYAVFFIALNTHRVKVSFVFFSARASVIFVVLVALVVGFVLGAVGPRLARRRKH
jgi:uncharacterized integral membrane protein